MLYNRLIVIHLAIHLADGVDNGGHHKMPGGLLDDCRANATNNIINKETLGSDNHLDETPEHEEGKHIKEKVPYARVVVHEHIGEQLEWVKVASLEVVHAEQSSEVNGAMQ